MSRQIINSPRVTPFRSATNHAIKAAGLVFVTGATPFKGERELVKGDLIAQVHQVMQNLKMILEDAGTSLDKAVKMNIALTDMSRYYEVDPVFRSYFAEGNYPTRQTIESPHLAHPDFLISIDCIAEA